MSTTADHIIPVDLRPDLEYERTNCIGACAWCNRRKSTLTLDEAIAKYGLEVEESRPDALDFFD